MNRLVDRYLEELRDDAEPAKRALAMATAICRYLDDLDEDEAGDDEEAFAPKLERAQLRADDLYHALLALLK